MQIKSDMNKTNNFKIAVITSEPYPNGSVGAFRIDTYCQAMAEVGSIVKIHISHPKKNTDTSKSNKYYGKVQYQYYNVVNNIDKLKRRSARVLNFLGSIGRILKDIIRNSPDFVIVYSYDVKLYIILRIYCSIFKKKLIIDRSEYPYKRATLSHTQSIIEKRIFKLFDGFIIMTNELITFYNSIKRNNAKIFHLPMTVDVKRFSVLKKNTDELYFASVFGIHNRDCIIDTIKAYELYFSKVQELNKEPFKLYLVGDINNLKDNGEAELYIKQNNLTNLIHFTGILTGRDYDQFLKNAFCLISSAREYISGGFPTKIGDYLATGNITIITKAGEIPNYLIDNIHSLLVSPSDINGISTKMFFVHIQGNEIEQIGTNGFNLAVEKFSMSAYLDDFINFLYKL